jgi:predicted permease
MWRRGQDDAVLREELSAHLEALEEEYRSSGLSAERARSAARQRFGNVTAIREDVREEFSFGGERLGQDVRFALRVLRRHRGFTALALASIALGVGVTTTVFTAVNGMLLRPLPFADADRIVVIHTRNVTRPDTGAVSWADFVSWRQAARSIEAMGTFGTRPAEFLDAGLEPSPLTLGVISPGYLPALGIAPIHGGGFSEEHQTFGNHFVALLSHAFWQRRYGGRAGVVGETITIEARPVPASPYVILGVLPEGASFPAGVDVFVPLQVDADEYERHGSRQAQGVIARLRPGVSFEQSRAEIVAISKALQAQFSRDNANREAEVTGLRDELVGDRHTPVLLLQAAAGLVMLIACANVASLMLARAGARRRELAVRAAIGAGRTRLMRQLLTESVILALAGGALGTLLAVLGARALVLLLPGGLPEYADVSVDVTVLIFVVALSAASGLLFGLGPAWRSTAIGATGLRESERIAGAPGTGRLRTTLITAEVALSFVLLVGATLVWRSNHSLSSEFRFDRRVVWVSIPTPAKYEGVQRETFFLDLSDRVRALPGVQSVGRAATGIPLGPSLVLQRVPVRFAEDAAASKVDSIVSEIDASYLQTLNVAIVHGRGFNADDRPASPVVRRFSAIVNETLARQLGGLGVVGKDVTAQLPGVWDLGTVTFTIVGISRDYRQERPPAPIAPLLHAYVGFGSSNTPLVVRTSGDPGLLRHHIQSIVRQLDPAVRVAVVQTFEESIAQGLAQELLYQRVLGLFALVAVGMAVVGLYGVVSYLSAQRLREFGIRSALGATRTQLFRLALGQGLRPAAIGVVIGIAAGLLSTRAIRSVLYGIEPQDPVTFILGALVLGLLAAVAGVAPAVRVARVNPTDVLRVE